MTTSSIPTIILPSSSPRLFWESPWRFAGPAYRRKVFKKTGPRLGHALGAFDGNFVFCSQGSDCCGHGDSMVPPRGHRASVQDPAFYKHLIALDLDLGTECIECHLQGGCPVALLGRKPVHAPNAGNPSNRRRKRHKRREDVRAVARVETKRDEASRLYDEV